MHLPRPRRPSTRRSRPTTATGGSTAASGRRNTTGARSSCPNTVGRLPYPDGHFDIVFTAEVLVHVRPEDLEGVLAELLRIAKWQVVHLETSPRHELVGGEHEGCWYHDLPLAYQRLGRHCETLPAGYSTHAPYRVALDSARPPYEWPPVSQTLLRRLDGDLRRGIAARDIGVSNQRQRAEQAEARKTELEARTTELETRRTELDARLAELDARAAEAQQALEQLRQARAEDERRIAGLQEDIRSAREQAAHIEARRAALEADAARLHGELAERDRVARARADEIARLQAEREELRRRIEALRADLDLQSRAAAQRAAESDRQEREWTERLVQLQTELDWRRRQAQAANTLRAAAAAQLAFTQEQLLGFARGIQARLRGYAAEETTRDDNGLPAAQMKAAEQSVAEAHYELEFIKQRLSYQLPARLRHTALYSALRWRHLKDDCVVVIHALGERNEKSQGREVWLLGARYEPHLPSIPWDYMSAPGGAWTRQDSVSAPYGAVLTAEKGRLKFPLHGADPELTFLTHPWSGRVEIAYRGRREVIDLYSPVSRDLTVHPGRTPMAPPPPLVEPAAELEPRPVPSRRSARPTRFTAEERRWLEGLRTAQPSVLAVHVPRWVGVSSSTVVLFKHTYPLPRLPEVEPYRIAAEEIRRHAQLILESGVKHIVCSGGDVIHFRLAEELRRRDPSVRCDVLLHASYQHFMEDYNWSIFRLWVDGARSGLVHTIGTVKKGMEEFFQALGLRARFVMNYVPTIPEGPSTPDGHGPHIGIWLSGENYLKKPYIMLSAARMIPDAKVRSSNFTTRAKEMMEFFGIPGKAVSDGLLPHARLLDEIRRTHLSLYVTFTECCPMLPLESLSVGVPCLTGPTSHLFEDHDYLHQRLVVPYPDRAEIIARHIRVALDERDEIVKQYIQYAPDYNARARKSVEEFLAGS
ncbi:MAG: methyltransferase domain-containing protein [Candidatus Sumerlaeota bacterium]|nr:methyltransferase domain-containing protein [Candidatus Sumerlaeota bacterium]